MGIQEEIEKVAASLKDTYTKNREQLVLELVEFAKDTGGNLGGALNVIDALYDYYTDEYRYGDPAPLISDAQTILRNMETEAVQAAMDRPFVHPLPDEEKTPGSFTTLCAFLAEQPYQEIIIKRETLKNLNPQYLGIEETRFSDGIKLKLKNLDMNIHGESVRPHFDKEKVENILKRQHLSPKQKENFKNAVLEEEADENEPF